MQVGTARVVWSFNINDPSDPLGMDANIHNYKGSLSINLLGGLINPPSEPADLQSFDLTISNVRETLMHAILLSGHAMFNVGYYSYCFNYLLVSKF